jgi:filamentous hemagglutinin family protein
LSQNKSADKVLFRKVKSHPTQLKLLPHLLAFAFAAFCAHANPQNPVVTRGSATFSTQGSTLTIHASANSTINWSSFNIGLGESTLFVQPSSTSLSLNRINDSNPSQILGHLDANGFVILENQNGFYVGGQASIQASGLVLTTAHAAPIEVMSGGAWQFSAPPPAASIINYGQINSANGAPIYVIAHDIQNHGEISAPHGNIGLFAGKEVMVSTRPDGRGISAQVKLPEGSVDNTGSLIADAGTIALRAQVVNQGGMIEANSVREKNGVIEIVASDSLNLGAGSVIQANGDSQGVSSGGAVTLKSFQTFADQSGSQISVTGGASGGSGGSVEVSAPSMAAINSSINGRAEPGYTGGKLAIDPTTINLGATGTGSAGGGTVNSGDSPTVLNLNVNSAFAGLSKIDLQATGNIALSTTWSLADSTGVSGAGCELTLEAGNNITFSSVATLRGGAGWAITLEAGRNFTVANTAVPGVPNSAAAGTVVSGQGSITLSGNATIQTQDGGISLLAGNNITVNGGAVRTVGGGSIDATALAGNINTGNNPNGYIFKVTGPISGSLGGISTAQGGNVNLFAGGSVTSFLPPSGFNSSPTDAGSGAFGPQPGVVTVTAGGDVTGHFVAANSTVNGVATASTITSENGSAGNGNALLALSLEKGGWQVNAPNGDIYLQEVRNSDGIFNGSASGKPASQQHLFDYAPDSFVDLNAPNGGVFLTGSLLPRYTGDNIPVLYPPILTVNSGAGGVTLQNNLTLFPSPSGQLSITTTGTLEGNGFQLAMSDSGSSQWRGPSSSAPTDFASDHAASPVQLNNPNPVVFKIGGNCDDISIVTPKETQITVKGEMDNTSFVGQNLRAADASTINVAGRIFEQNTYAFVTLSGSGLPLPPSLYPGAPTDYLQVLKNAVVHGSGPNSANGGALFPTLNLFYLPSTHQLGYYGTMDSATAALLSGTFQEKTFYADGKPVLDANGNYVTTTATFAGAGSIAALRANSQNAIPPSSAASGFLIGGPGQLNITAASMDLGASGGLNSVGPGNNPALAKISSSAATINLVLTDGDLNLFASKISSQYTGGNINIDVQNGAVNAGLGALPFGQLYAAYGIWASGLQDNVTVIAKGDINVDGARIAAYDGGNVTVQSLSGNVDAGSGASGEVRVGEVVLAPGTLAVSNPQQPIAGSGILATTLPNSARNVSVGDITVSTPEGNIAASAGGIAQVPANGNASTKPTVTLTAGTRDANGTVVHTGDISAGDSGIIGINTSLNAAGSISGLVIAQVNSSINAAANVSGTFLAGGTSSFNAGGSVSGIAIAGGSINVGSGKFEGVALSQNVSGGGAVTALATQATAAATSQSAAAQQADSQKTETTDALAAAPAAEDDSKKVKRPLLAKYTGRVTVILPKGK